MLQTKLGPYTLEMTSSSALAPPSIYLSPMIIEIWWITFKDKSISKGKIQSRGILYAADKVLWQTLVDFEDSPPGN